MIAACAKIEGAGIHRGDETGPRSDDVRGRSRSPHGQMPMIRVDSERHGPSVIYTVTKKGQMRWTTIDRAANSKVLIDLMRRLILDAGRKIYLVLDSLRVQDSRPVEAWLGERRHEIEALHLASHGPEVNADEMTNAVLKQGATKLALARMKLQHMKATSLHQRGAQRQTERLRKYFEHEPVRNTA